MFTPVLLAFIFQAILSKVRFEAEDQKPEKSQTTNSFSDSEVKIDSDGDYELPRPKKYKEVLYKKIKGRTSSKMFIAKCMGLTSMFHMN